MEQFSTEEQQAEAVRKWLKDNGSSIFIGIGLGLLVMYGVNWWHGHQSDTAEAASLQYVTLQQVPANAEPGSIAAQAERLREDFPESAYAAFGALTAARVALQQATPDYPTAATELDWVMEHSPLLGLRQIARLRLARMKLAAGDTDAAMALLQGQSDGAFAQLMAEVRGDVAMAAGDSVQARQAYTQALDEGGSGDTGSVLLRMKLENLGGTAG